MSWWCARKPYDRQTMSAFVDRMNQIVMTFFDYFDFEVKKAEALRAKYVDSSTAPRFWHLLGRWMFLTKRICSSLGKFDRDRCRQWRQWPNADHEIEIFQVFKGVIGTGSWKTHECQKRLVKVWCYILCYSTYELTQFCADSLPHTTYVTDLI